MIVAEDAYEVAEPTIDSHVVKMKSLTRPIRESGGFGPD
jgi:branched-chain amino acid transport system substrate-binding protein